jgi:L-iditol 2-dehydrogenase
MPEGSCLPIPAHLSYDQAALSEPLAIGLYAVRRSVPMAGARIGILGYGPIGMSVALCARQAGCERVYVTERLDYRCDIARATGADGAWNIERDDAVAAIAAAEPDGLDVVFECCGEQAAVDQALHLLAPGGTLMIVGIPPELSHWTLPTDLMRRREITVRNVRRQNGCAEDALDLITSGAIDVRPMATHHFPLARTAEAFALVEGYHDGVIKAMIAIDAEGGT